MTLYYPPIQTTSQPSSNAITTSIASTVTQTTLLAANQNRLGAIIYNNSNANLFIGFGAGNITITAGFAGKIPAGGYYELSSVDFVGQITGIWDKANGAAQIVEFS